MVSVVYPGTFDPITNGHVDLIERALGLFDHVIVAVATGYDKKTLFNEQERIALASKVLQPLENVEVVKLNGLLADFIDEMGAKAIIRGLRAVSDFEYEFQMASINRRLNPRLETVFLTPDEKYACLSSTMIRQVAKIDPNRVDGFVHPLVLTALQSR